MMEKIPIERILTSDDLNSQRRGGTINYNRLRLSHVAIPPLFENVWKENLEELDKEIAEKQFYGQNPDLVNTERFLGDALIHIATKAKKLGSLQILLKNGAKVSLPDGIGDTALHNAVIAGWHEGILELLQNGASPDKLSEPPSTLQEAFPKTALHIAINKGDSQSVALLLRQSPNLSLHDGLQRNILHMAAEAHNLKLVTRFLHDPLCHELISQKDGKGNGILHVAIQMKTVEEEQEDEVEKTIFKIVELLIENGIDVNSANLLEETPVYLAAKYRLPKVAEILLNSGADLSLITNSKNTVLHAACESNCDYCLDTFLKTGKVKQLITMRNNKGKEPFHLAIDSGSTECCEILLRHGDHLGYRDCNGDTRCSLILNKIPNAVDMLKRVFDNHIHVSKKCQRDPNFCIKFDYAAILRPQTEELQYSLIPKLTDSQFIQLLKHPLLESFLFLKWNRLKFIFYIYVLLYFIFCSVHSYFIYYTFGHKNKMWKDDLKTLFCIRILLGTLYGCFLIPGIVMVLNNKRFLKERETYYISFSVLCSVFVVFSPNIECVDNHSVMIERPIAAISAILAWGELMLLLEKFPTYGKYISMLANVARSTIKVLVGFFCLLMGFTVCFSIIYNDQNVFSTFMRSFVKILMMMIGEYNYVEMPKSENESETRETKHLIMYFGSALLILFLFLVSILMTNLFIGVAVYDIGELLQHGKMERLYKQAQYIISYENLLKSFVKNHWGTRIPRLLTQLGQIQVNPKYYPNKYGSKFKLGIPSDTIKESIKIKQQGMGKEEMLQNNRETDAAKIMRTFSIFYMSNLHKQRKQQKLFLNRLENLETFLKSHLSKDIETNECPPQKFTVQKMLTSELP